MTASGGNAMGTLHADVYDVPRGFTDPGVALTRTVVVPLSFEKVVGQMTGLAAEITAANIRYGILSTNSNAATFSLFQRMGVTVQPPVWVPGYDTRVP